MNLPPSDKLLLEAVELRIGGFKWEVVAQKLRRSVHTVRQWPVRYPDRWQAAIERAEQRLSVDSNAESVLILRNLLRAEETAIRLHAAQTLVRLRLGLGKLALQTQSRRGDPAPAEDPLYAQFKFLNSFSDQELRSKVEAIGFWSPLEHGHSDEARPAAEPEQNATCGDSEGAHHQHGPSATLPNACSQGESDEHGQEKTLAV